MYYVCVTLCSISIKEGNWIYIDGTHVYICVLCLRCALVYLSVYVCAIVKLIINLKNKRQLDVFVYMGTEEDWEKKEKRKKRKTDSESFADLEGSNQLY